MLDRTLSLILGDDDSAQTTDVAVRDVVIAGWTGRDKAALEKHILELEALGVRRPATTPVFYRVSASRVTVGEAIETIGTTSSGEVEFVLLQTGGQLWLGVGSDHTDREVETYGVTVSKQLCEKPVAARFWRFDEIGAHWDRLMLRSWVGETHGMTLYQEGGVDALLEPGALIARYTADGRLPEGTMMFGGTLAARGGIRPSEQFHFEIEDPVRRRKIGHRYRVRALPIAG